MQTINLRDEWIFTKQHNVAYSSELVLDGEAISLPHTWNQLDGQGNSDNYYRGQCWYQRKLVLDDKMLEKTLYLEIGAVGNIGEVYINGQLAGESRCGYAMFRVPLNPHARPGENLISIMADNRHHNDVLPLMADFTFYGGLYREVKLLILEQVHFDVSDLSRDGIYVSQRKIGAEQFELKITGSIVNETSQTSDGTVVIKLYDAEGNIVLESSTKVKINDIEHFNIPCIIESPTLWDGVDNPYLYTVEIALIIEEQTYDKRTIEIGFRTIEVTPDRGMLLNGKEIKLKGVSRHQDYADVGNAITKTHMDEDMDIILEMGANSIRLAHYQHDDYFYTLCDRKGLLVWAEIPFISIRSTEDPENKNALEQLERLIKQAYNHCSIYCWGVQNEITIAVEDEHIYRLISNLSSSAKRLDAGRLTAQANIYSVENSSPIHKYTDLTGYNLYYGWYYGEMEDLGKRLDQFHTANPEIPVILSEYGVDTNPQFHTYSPTVKDYTEEYQLLYHYNAIKTLNNRDYILGGYVWNMFDFGSAARNEGGEKGKNLKGLVSLDRKLKKDAYFLYKACWSQEPFVYLTGRRFENRHQQLNNITILSNLNHIRLYLNGSYLMEIESEEPLIIVDSVQLDAGKNHIMVKGFDEAGNAYTDEMNLNYVTNKDDRYIYVNHDQKRNVVNWFEKFDLSNVQEITLKEGYFSTFDTVEQLYSNDEAKVVFQKYFGAMGEDPRFAAMKPIMSIEKMAKLSAFNIPKKLLSEINRELNSIKKLN